MSILLSGPRLESQNDEAEVTTPKTARTWNPFSPLAEDEILSLYSAGPSVKQYEV